jgi:YesN/AraC family two-component response regulator
VWAERALFLLKPVHEEPLAKHLVKLCQSIRCLNSGPQIFWKVRSAETAQAANREIKLSNWQVSGSITYIWQPLPGHTTEKYQRKMQLIRSLPARPCNRVLD